MSSINSPYQYSKADKYAQILPYYQIIHYILFDINFTYNYARLI